MRASGTNRCIAQVKQPRRGQSRGLLHPVRFAVHEDPEPELEVDERPDHIGRQDTLAQPVGLKDSPVETPWGSEDVLHGACQLTGEPSPHRNRERPLVPALDDARREQGPDDLIQKALRLAPAHLEGRGDAGDQLNDSMVQEWDAGLERYGHAHAVFQGQELGQVDPQIVIEALVENLIRARLLKRAQIGAARGIASERLHEPGVKHWMARGLGATVRGDPVILERTRVRPEPSVQPPDQADGSLPSQYGPHPLHRRWSLGWST